MTVELFKEFEEIAPSWWGILNNDKIIAQQGNYNIKNPDCCFVGEMYMGKNYAEQCYGCKQYSYLFMDLIYSIPLKLNIEKWSEARINWRPELASITGSESFGVPQDRMKRLQDRLLKMDSVITTYRDFFNVIANDYMQHLSGCNHYNMQAGILR